MRIKVIVLIVILAVGGIWFFLPKSPAPAAVALKPVTLNLAKLRAVVSATGTVEPQNRLEIMPQMAGRLESVLVREGDAVQKGQILAWMSSTERAALLDAARMQNKDTVAYWENVYKATPLISPINGTVIVRSLEPGQTVGTSTPVVVLSDRLVVNAQVDETDIGKVKVGQAVEISLDAYPEDIIPGRVTHIAYESKVVSNVTIYEVKIIPLQYAGNFRSGMGANVTIVQKQKTVQALPLEAVTTNARGSFVLLAQESSPPVPKKVVTGMADEKQIEIVSGLAPTATVLMKDTTLDLKKRKAKSSSPFMPARRAH